MGFKKEMPSDKRPLYSELSTPPRGRPLEAYLSKEDKGMVISSITIVAGGIIVGLAKWCSIAVLES